MKTTIKAFQFVFMLASALLAIMFFILLMISVIGYNVEKPKADARGGMNDSIGLTNYFEESELDHLSLELAKYEYVNDIANDPDYLENNPLVIQNCKSTILAKYTLHGNTYYYNLYPVLNTSLIIQSIVYIVLGIYCFIINLYCFMVIKKKNEYSTKLGVLSILSLNIPSGVLTIKVSNKE